MARASDTSLGVAWLLSDLTLVTGMTVLVKKMGADYPAVQLVFLRSLIGLLLILPLVWRDRASLSTMQAPLRNGFRVMCNAGALTANFVALGALPLGIVNAVSYLRPVVTMLLAIALLGETVPRARWLASAGILAGVALAVGPDVLGAGGSALPMAGLIAVTVSLGLGAMATVQTRALRSEAPVVMMLFYTAGLTLLTALPAGLSWHPIAPAHWPALLGIGALAQAGQYCFLRAYRAAEASRLAPFSYSSILFAISAGWLFFDERPSWHLLAGASVILLVLLLGSRTPKPRPLT
ncbi:MAG: DMT family transporter [Rhodobacteraceae bacterium]|nr:DMT family transporter [Paracoccaceae bacterium]MBR9822500.1 DMT family transporter [Paracoccaceae bacterium]